MCERCDTLTAERDAARERSEYWKAEHAAANEVIDTIRADRARLAACVERVRGLCERADHWEESLDGKTADCYVDVTSILAALEGA
jgi:predicted nuclease with TOPRIM domain